MRHTPRAQSLLPARFPLVPAPHPFGPSFPSRSARLLSAPPVPCARVPSAFQPALYRLKVRAPETLPFHRYPPFFVSISFFLFVPLPRVCLPRSLVRIIPGHGNYRYPWGPTMRLRHTFNKRIRGYFSVLIYSAAAPTMKISTPDTRALVFSPRGGDPPPSKVCLMDDICVGLEEHSRLNFNKVVYTMLHIWRFFVLTSKCAKSRSLFDVIRRARSKFPRRSRRREKTRR